MSDLKLPNHISGCGDYGKAFLAGMEHQNNVALQKSEIFKQALEQICHYVEQVDKDYYDQSESWKIANKALREATLNELTELTQSQYQDYDNPMVSK